MKPQASDEIAARMTVWRDDGVALEVTWAYALSAGERTLYARDLEAPGQIRVWCVGPRLTPLAQLRRIWREWRVKPLRLPTWFARENDLTVDAAAGRVLLRVRGYLSDGLDKLEFHCTLPDGPEPLLDLAGRWRGQVVQSSSTGGSGV